MADFWIDTPKPYVELDHESRQFYLHPWLRERISKLQPQRILDFGCGDGSLFKAYQQSYEELWLHDHSARMIDLARSAFEHRPDVHFLSDAHAIPNAYFDVVVCSLVIMTIGTKEKLYEVASRMHASAATGSCCLVAATHPCFRQYAFSTFETEFVHKPFDYMSVGAPFRVKLSDMNRKNFVEFTDFHWPLGFTLNLFIDAGYDLRSMVELTDSAACKGLKNPHFPGYIVLEFRKR